MKTSSQAKKQTSNHRRGNNTFWGSNNQNLWIVLGVVLGTLVLAFTLGLVMVIHRRIRKRGLRKSLLMQRNITPIDDAEIESWRNLGKENMGNSRYTMMPRQPPSAICAKEYYTIRNNDLAMNTNIYSRYASPVPSISRGVRRSYRSSLADRAPTPYSALLLDVEKRDLYSPPVPPSPTSTMSSATVVSKPVPRSKLNTRYPPSISESSEYDFDFDFQFADFSSGALREILEEPHYLTRL